MFEGQLLSGGAGGGNNVGGDISRSLATANSIHLDGSFQTRENTLIIYNVHRRHSGRYRCIAANSQGEGLSEEIQLKIQCKLVTESVNGPLSFVYLFCPIDKPVCKQTQRFLFGVAKSEAIQVPCTVEADPEEGVTFRWSFNNSYNLQPITFQQPSLTAPMTSVATYVPRTKYGFGQLLCWAKNRLGRLRQHLV